MRVKVKVRSSSLTSLTLDAEPQADYPLRVSSFFASVGVHGGIVAALLAVSTLPVASPPRSVYEEFIKPHENKILFYDLRTRTPDVDPVEPIGGRDTPRGTELSRQAVIATSPKPKSTQLFISVPAPAMEIHQDVPAPLVIAKADVTFSPPPEQPKPRKFVPPPPAKRDVPLPIQTPVVDAPSISTARTAPAPVVPVPVFAAVPPPPIAAPESNTSQSGNAKVDIAVASLHPSENLDAAVPNADRPARFSKAPVQGPAASGGKDEASLTVPNLTVRQPKPDIAPPPPTKQILYTDLVRGIPVSTLSAPLRPSSRSIPKSIEARFQGRDVYTMVIPMENMPAYSGDWIMWFADRQPNTGATPLVRAPIPVRKVEVVDQTPASGRVGARIQLAATLRVNGRLDGVTILSEASLAVQRAVSQDVASWEFRPATRDGVAIDTEVVLEIPFSLPATIAKGP